MGNNFNGLKKLVENLRSIKGTNSVPMRDILTDSFIQSNTDFQSIDDLFEKAGYQVESQEDFEAIPQEDVDTFVRENTKYESFTDLQQEAVNEYFGKLIFKGL